MPLLKILRLGHRDSVCIRDQLRIEEAVYRNFRSESAKGTGWLILNHPGKAQQPTIVLGFSGKPEKLVCEETRRKSKPAIPMLKRFTVCSHIISTC